MNLIKEGWFSEVSELWPGQSMSLQVEEVLFNEKSKFQDVLVFRRSYLPILVTESKGFTCTSVHCSQNRYTSTISPREYWKHKTYGNVLVLDGVIQCTERDEFSYQEMLAHLPLNCHPNPRKVLIIGGGDGGVLREVVKHPEVQAVEMCEIDEKVIEVSKKYLPKMAIGFQSSKLTLHIGDGFEYMKKHQGEFDVIITDSSDPIGPASSLFEKSYYELMKKALKPGGIVCCQGECLWLHLELIKGMQEFCHTLYPVVDYAYTTIPTYPSGQIGFILCGLNPDADFKNPVRKFSKEESQKLRLQYYNEDIHRSAFILPEFARKVLRGDSKTMAENGN